MCNTIFFITLNTEEERKKLEFGLNYYGTEIYIPNTCNNLIYNLNEGKLDRETLIRILKYADVNFFTKEEPGIVDKTNKYEIPKFIGKWKVQKYEERGEKE